MADRERNLRKMAEDLRNYLYDEAKTFDYLLRNRRIAGITGCAVAAASGVAATIGFVLIPLTFGASAGVVGLAGSVLGTLGTITAGGASLFQTTEMQKKMKLAQQELSAFQQALADDKTGDSEALLQIIKEWSLEVDEDGLFKSVICKPFRAAWQCIKKRIVPVDEGGKLKAVREAICKPFRAAWQFIKERIVPVDEGGTRKSVREAICKPFRAAWQFIKKGKTILSELFDGAVITGSVAWTICKIVRAAWKGVRVLAPVAKMSLRVLSHVLSGALILLDLADIIYMSVQLRKGKGSNTGNAMRKLADDLDKFLQTGECSTSATEDMGVQRGMAEQE